MGLLAGIGQRFLNFCERFGGHFRQRTRTVETAAQQYVRGLLQAETKNMERMEEVIPDADHQALQHMLSASAWSERAVLDQVAQDANRLLGGYEDSALLIDESGCPKKGTQSVGVARQWCGQLGKVENCQVGVFAALSRGSDVTLIDERLFLPEVWTTDAARCQAAGIPKAQRGFQRKTDLALAMITHARQQGIGFAWVGFDGFYGNDPAFLRALEDQGEIFVGDVHKDQRIYLEDPQPIIPPAKAPRGRPPTALQAQTPALRVDRWVQQQPATAWQPVTLRDGTKGPLRVDILHQRVWLWDGEEAQARQWHLIVRREIDDPTEIKYSLSNAMADTPAPRLAFMQGQRYGVEHALRQGKQDVGLGDYQVRGWRGWHHHLALVMMAMLFLLEERQLHQQTRPLWSGRDIRALLNHFLPRRDTTLAEVLRQMEVRHRKRQAATDSAYRKQQLNE
ncbi:MAG: IS701 family transposase [Candidatus Competibacteraceae bacterium]